MSGSLSLYLTGVLEWTSPFLVSLSWGLLIFGLLINLKSLLEVLAAWRAARTHSRGADTDSAWQLLISDFAIPISIIVPLKSDDSRLVERLRSMLDLNYPDFEIIVVNEDLTGKVLEVLSTEFALAPIVRTQQLRLPHEPIKDVYASSLAPQLFVVDKGRAPGRADARNAGINVAQNTLFCIVDTDTAFDFDLLMRSIRPFMENPEMVAVGGTKCFQAEYLPSRLLQLFGWAHWGMTSFFSGSFGIFRRAESIAAGGFSPDGPGEDREMILRLQKLLKEKKRPCGMSCVPAPLYMREVPSGLKLLRNGRKRWAEEAAAVFYRNFEEQARTQQDRKGLARTRNNFSAYQIGPCAWMAGTILIPILWLNGFLTLNFVLAWFSVYFVFGNCVSVASLLLTERTFGRTLPTNSFLSLLGVSMLENIGYRPFMYFLDCAPWLRRDAMEE